MSNSICFDIGGTFIKYGVINLEGKIIIKNKMKTPIKNCINEIPRVLVEKILEFKNIYNIKACGISTAGQVDNEKGEIIFASNSILDYTGTKLSEIIKEKTGLLCFVENDVNSAALAEMWMGAAKGHSTFICLTLGTGIGGAIVIDGKLYRGVKGSAGEIGHMIINEEGRECGCKNKGCYESYASTSAFIREYEKEANIKRNEINGKKLMELVKDGDAIASRVYDEFIHHIVTGLVGITHILDPGLIIIGGGISEQGKPFFDEVNFRLKKSIMSSYANHTSVVPAELKNDAGIIGACFLTKNYHI